MLLFSKRDATREILRDLGDGLVLRRGRPEDAEPLATFNAMVLREPWMTGPDEHVAAWTRDLVLGRHPWMTARDFTVVEDTGSGEIISSVCLIPQTWTYAGIPLGVGRPELVGTHPDYRRRGLVRAQFEVIHAWSAEQGHLLQAITGIPEYYRQFGYEMAVDLGSGRSGTRDLLPKLAAGQPEPYRLRPATAADLPLVLRLAEQAQARSLLSAVRDAEHWRYEIDGRSPDSLTRMELRILETAEGAAAGLLVHFPTVLWHDMITAAWAEALPGVSWLAAAPTVLRYLAEFGDARASQGDKQYEAVCLQLAESHPLVEVARDWLPRTRPAYAWYLRVADLPAFLRRITPVLEQRLAASGAAGHTGELLLNFYRGGVRLVFEQGRIATVDVWQPASSDAGHAAFPDLTFLKLLFGHRDLAELRHMFPDCWVDGTMPRVLLGALFPSQAATIWPVD